MCTESAEFRIPGIVDIILYRKYICKPITYDVPIKPHKTRG